MTAEVKGRDLDTSGNLNARAGDTVVVTLEKKNGRLPDYVNYSYTDRNGKKHQVEINPSTVTGRDLDSYAFATVTENSDEYILSFYMPDADENGVTIHTQFISNEENPSWMPSYSMNFGPRAMGLKSLRRKKR